MLTNSHYASLPHTAMSETTSENPLPHVGKPATSDPAIPIVSVEQSFSEEDKMFLYAVLQEIANELRRIKHERKKH